MNRIKRNKASLYIDGKMEYQAVNLEKEYGTEVDGCKYAVASRHSKVVMSEMYKDDLVKFEPYIYLTEAEYEVIYKFQLNENKYENRRIRKHDAFEFDEEITPVLHRRNDFDEEMLQDPLNIIIETQDAVEWESMLKRIPAALDSLKEPYKTRIYKYFYKKKTILEIAEEEGISKQAVWSSIIYAKKRMKKIIENKK